MFDKFDLESIKELEDPVPIFVCCNNYASLWCDQLAKEGSRFSDAEEQLINSFGSVPITRRFAVRINGVGQLHWTLIGNVRL